MSGIAFVSLMSFGVLGVLPFALDWVERWMVDEEG